MATWARIDEWDEPTREVVFVPSSELAARTWRRIAETEAAEQAERDQAEKEPGNGAR